MRISDWSSDVCSSDLIMDPRERLQAICLEGCLADDEHRRRSVADLAGIGSADHAAVLQRAHRSDRFERRIRSEEHTSELQSLMRISYAVFCLKKKKHRHKQNNNKHKPHHRSYTQNH